MANERIEVLFECVFVRADCREEVESRRDRVRSMVDRMRESERGRCAPSTRLLKLLKENANMVAASAAVLLGLTFYYYWPRV